MAEPEISGRWVNDGGTVIGLVAHEDGRVSGRIRFGSDGNAYKPYGLRGAVVVRPDGGRGIVGTMPGWPVASGSAVWFGELDQSGATLRTKLLVAAGLVPVADFEAIMGGTVFRRVQDHLRTA